MVQDIVNYVTDEISVIILTYNDKEVIKQSVDEVYNKLKQVAKKFEIIVIDDCSTDGTREIVKGFSGRYPEVVQIHHAKNSGIGEGLRDGFKIAKYDLVQTNCADLPFDVVDLKEAIPYMEREHADVCVMVRHDRSANSWFRKITSYVNYLIIKTLFGIPIEDYNFVQLYKNKVVKSITLEAQDVFVPPELIIKSYDRCYKVVQFRTKFHKRKAGRSKYGHIKYFIRTFYDQIKFWYLLRIKKTT